MATPQKRGSRSIKPAPTNEDEVRKNVGVYIPVVTRLGIAMALGVLLLAAIGPLGLSHFAVARTVPDQAQVIDQRAFLVLETVPPPVEANATTVSLAFL